MWVCVKERERVLVCISEPSCLGVILRFRDSKLSFRKLNWNLLFVFAKNYTNRSFFSLMTYYSSNVFLYRWRMRYLSRNICRGRISQSFFFSAQICFDHFSLKENIMEKGNEAIAAWLGWAVHFSKASPIWKNKQQISSRTKMEMDFFVCGGVHY